MGNFTQDELRQKISNIDWSKRYKITAHDLTLQHELVYRSFKEIEAFCDSADLEKVSSRLNHLKFYFNSHFYSEEVLMGSHTYPALFDHMVQHDNLSRKLDKIMKAVSSGSLTDCQQIKEQLGKVRETFNEHEKNSDQAFDRFMEGQ
jgi:hemerythrin-like metal-binding protein